MDQSRGRLSVPCGPTALPREHSRGRIHMEVNQYSEEAVRQPRTEGNAPIPKNYHVGKALSLVGVR